MALYGAVKADSWPNCCWNMNVLIIQHDHPFVQCSCVYLISCSHSCISYNGSLHFSTILCWSHEKYPSLNTSPTKWKPLHQYQTCTYPLPITWAARSEPRTVFARSKTLIVGSNTTSVMDVCVRLFCVCVLLCVQPAALRRADPPSKDS
jgi:hypothetical protein